MQLEDYFEFEPQYDRIRIKGSRIGIEHVLETYKQGVTAEAIVNEHFQTLTLEKVYATLTYYFHNQAEVEDYLRRTREMEERLYQDYLRQPLDEFRLRMRRLSAERQRNEAQS